MSSTVNGGFAYCTAFVDAVTWHISVLKIQWPNGFRQSLNILTLLTQHVLKSLFTRAYATQCLAKFGLRTYDTTLSSYD